MREVLKQLSYRELEILNIIQNKGSITKKDLQVITDTKLTTLNRAMKTLENQKLIMEVGTSESTGGRKAVEYSVVQHGIYVIGIDISRTYVKVILSNLRMDILKFEEFQMNNSFSPLKTVDTITSLIEKMLDELSIKKNEVLGIGIGTIGPLDRMQGILLNPRGFFYENWTNVPLKDMIESKVSILCFIDNGANTAVLAESMLGEGKGLKNVVYIHCGIGIRSAVITDGNIIRTINDAEDAFAHMIIESNGEKCICGNRGCIESYSSIGAIVKRFISKTNNKQKEDINKEIKEEDYKEILKLALAKNETAREILNKGAEALGIGLSNLVKLLNPQLVVLSGPLIMNYGPFYEGCIEEFYKNNCLNNEVIFSKGGQFQENVIAIGACEMVIEDFLKRN